MVASLLLVIGASAIAVSYQQAKSARANAELKEKSDESLVYLLQLSNLMYTNGLPSEALEKMEQLLFVARDKYQDKPSDQAQVFLCEVLNGVGVTQHKSGQIDEAMATFGELDELLSHVITESNGRLNLKWLQLIVAMRSNYGMTLRTHALRNGQSLDHAVGNYERAIPFCERVIAETNDSPDSWLNYARLLANFADTLSSTSDSDHELRRRRESVGIFRKLLQSGIQHPVVIGMGATHTVRLAHRLIRLERQEEAAQELRVTMALHDVVERCENPDQAAECLSVLASHESDPVKSDAYASRTIIVLRGLLRRGNLNAEFLKKDTFDGIRERTDFQEIEAALRL